MKTLFYFFSILFMILLGACGNDQQQQQNLPPSNVQDTTLKKADYANLSTPTRNSNTVAKPKPTTPRKDPTNFNVRLDEDMKSLLSNENTDKQLLRKAKSEAAYFANYINGIVQLTDKQKSTITELAVTNIHKKLDLQQQMQLLKKKPNSDFNKIRTTARAIAYQHQEEVAYLKKELNPEQFKKYMEHQNKKVQGLKK